MTRLTLRAAEVIVVHVFVFARRTLDTVVGRTPLAATRAVDTLWHRNRNSSQHLFYTSIS